MHKTIFVFSQLILARIGTRMCYEKKSQNQPQLQTHQLRSNDIQVRTKMSQFMRHYLFL